MTLNDASIYVKVLMTHSYDYGTSVGWRSSHAPNYDVIDRKRTMGRTVI